MKKTFNRYKKLPIYSPWQYVDPKLDLLAAMMRWHVWTALGWHDIKQRYRRSILGPFWFTLSTLILVGVLGLLYSKLLNQDISNYLPYLGVGLVLWQYISTCILEGANALISAGSLIKQVPMPVSVHLLRVVWRNTIILFHSLPVVLVLMIALGGEISVDFLYSILGLLIMALNLIWMSLVISISCARFRDIIPLMSNIVQVAFFFTPIMWSIDLLNGNEWIVKINIFFHIIDIVRSPLLGQSTELSSWICAVLVLIFGTLFSNALLKKYRNRVAYWV